MKASKYSSCPSYGDAQDKPPCGGPGTRKISMDATSLLNPTNNSWLPSSKNNSPSTFEKIYLRYSKMIPLLSICTVFDAQPLKRRSNFMEHSHGHMNLRRDAKK